MIKRMESYKNFNSAYYTLVDDVNNRFEYKSAPRGYAIKERLCETFTIDNPLDRLLYVPHRGFSVQYCIAEMLWYLLGNNQTEWISNYSSFWKNISDDGTTANSAYGARIFKKHPLIDFVQWEYVINELQKDSDSRRAVIHIRHPQDSVSAKKDMPCTLTLQFFIRDKALHLVASMRSSDLIFGISYDVPAFTLLQELMAQQLDVAVGSYMHVSNSLHIYERHFEMAEKICREYSTDQHHVRDITDMAMPPLPKQLPIYELDEFQFHARNVETLEELVTIESDITYSQLDPYWKDWALILLAHRAKKLGFASYENDLMNNLHNQCYVVSNTISKIM